MYSPPPHFSITQQIPLFLNLASRVLHNTCSYINILGGRQTLYFVNKENGLKNVFPVICLEFITLPSEYLTGMKIDSSPPVTTTGLEGKEILTCL